MAFEKFVPTFWAEKIERENDKLLVLAPLTNRKWEGLIKEKGDTVNILGIGKPTIGDYDGGDIGSAEELSDTSVKLSIDKAKYFNVAIDDVDKRQAVNGVMEDILAECNEEMACCEDSDIAKVMEKEAGLTIKSQSVTKDNVRALLQSAKTKLMENGVKQGTDLCVVVTPLFLEKIEQAVENLDTNNSSVVETGYVGKTSGFKIYVSNNLVKNKAGKEVCFAFTKRATAHAKQISKIEAYRPEGKFCDAVKGLSLYGSKVVRPKELVKIEVGAYA